ncbi:MAG: hypothetical protein LUI87_16195 [Lachnospiraceae bacterium]|nr:hypothetical protein [Lachnospiraceae bacterium]
MNKGLKRAAVFGLSASLLATSLAGCSKSESSAFDADAVLMTINEEEVPAGLFKFAVHYSQAQTQYIYDSYFGDNSFSYEYSDGYTIGDMVKSSALASFEEMILARQHMDEYEVELTEDEETAISEAAAAFIEANDEEVLTAMSATQEIVEEYLSLITIQNKMETAMSADVDREVSDEEAAQRRIEYVYVAMETEGETEEETDTEEAETDSEAAESDSEEETAEADSDEDNEETETAADTESETALLTGTTAVKTTSADETETETADAGEAETDAAEEDTEDAEDAEADEETDTEEASEEETEIETETETEDPEVVAAMEEAYAKAEQIIALVQDGTDLEEAAQSIDEDLSVNEITFGSDSTSVVEGLITSTEGLDDDTLVEYPVEASSGYYVVRVVNAFDEEATEEEKESIIEERISDAIDELYTEWEEDADISTDEDVYATITFDFNLSLYEEETETDTEEASEEAAEDETDAESESETEAASDAETEEETEAASDAETEEETETASDAETEEETEAASDAETEEETVAETEAVETESETEE